MARTGFASCGQPHVSLHCNALEKTHQGMGLAVMHLLLLVPYVGPHKQRGGLLSMRMLPMRLQEALMQMNLTNCPHDPWMPGPHMSGLGDSW